jgi:hypothetical protein
MRPEHFLHFTASPFFPVSSLKHGALHLCFISASSFFLIGGFVKKRMKLIAILSMIFLYAIKGCSAAVYLGSPNMTARQRRQPEHVTGAFVLLFLHAVTLERACC